MFLYPVLAAGLAFIAVPPIVHLINLLRHRRQRWAAMDFLLASYKKQKKWVRLRQILLLLTRMVAAGLLAAMLAGWTGSGPVAELIGGGSTHHVIIIDDSVSMGGEVASIDGGNTTAYTRALTAVSDLVRQIVPGGGDQLTVIRSSSAALAISAGGDSADAAADVLMGTVTPDRTLIAPLMSSEVSPLVVSPVAAMDLAVELIDRGVADETRLYVISDFRTNDWQTPERIADSLGKLPGDVAVRLIDCGGDAALATVASNLAITSLTPAPDVWVAGVPVVMRMSVRNFGSTEINNVQPTIRVVRYGDEVQSIDPTKPVSGAIETLPVAAIGSIPAGGESVLSFQVFVATPGTHAIMATLPSDALATDNARVCMLPLTDAEKVLVIDGDENGRGGYAISSVLDPGSQVRIGAVPDVRPPSFLRDATTDSLSVYRAIYLSDIDQIGDNAAAALLGYVQQGGGLALFIGPSANTAAYNEQLHRRGLLPGKLERIEPLERSTEAGASDFVLTNVESTLTDPIRAVGDAAMALVSLSNSWAIEADAETAFQTLIKRRDGLPLIASATIGNGRVVTSLTGLSSEWTNWPGDPTFVVFLLQTNAALYSGIAPAVFRLPTDELAIAPERNGDPTIRIPVARFAPPAGGAATRGEIETPAESGQRFPRIDPASRLIDDDASVPLYMRPGIGEWAYAAGDGRTVVTPVATVIDSSDGNLARTDPAAILQSLPGVNASFLSSAALTESLAPAAGSKLTLWLLGLLAVCLAIEQALAAWASYHARPITPRGERLSGSPVSGLPVSGLGATR